jgi:hypothetical protein
LGRIAAWRHDPNVRLGRRWHDPGRPARKPALGLLAVSDLFQRSERAVVFFDGVPIGQSASGAPNGHNDGHADQHNQEQCAHQGDPLTASRLMFERD